MDGSSGSNSATVSQEVTKSTLDIIKDAVVALPSQILSTINSILKGGIDIVGSIIGILFGTKAETNIEGWLNNLVDTLFNPSEWLNLIISGVDVVVGAILGFGPLQMIIDAIFGEGTTQGLQTAIMDFLTYLSTLPSQILTYLTVALTNIMNWGMELWNAAINIASTFITTIITWVSQLPGQIWTWLVNTAGRISAFASVALSRAITIGTNILNGVLTNVRQIPQMVYNELLRVGTLIMSAGGALYQKALALGQGIWQKVKEGLGIGSPGHIYWMIFDEFGRVNSLMDSTSKTWEDNAQNLGNSIIDGFGDVSLKMKGPVLENLKNTDLMDLNSHFGSSEWFYRNGQNRVVNYNPQPSPLVENSSKHFLNNQSESNSNVVNDNRTITINIEIPQGEITNTSDLNQLAQILADKIGLSMHKDNIANIY